MVCDTDFLLYAAILSKIRLSDFYEDVHGELVPAKREICIQDLLNMTSGIPYPDCQSESQKKKVKRAHQ